jgi:cyclic beta-1,2-glucan synthetase
MWAILATAKLGLGDRAVELFEMLNPLSHTRTSAEVGRYKVEPYVVAADVYSVAPHAGRGGWTWYTGAAGWMYRAGVEGILGLRREGAVLVVAPCLPASWPGFAATVTLGASVVEVVVARAAPGEGVHASLDGESLPFGTEGARVPLDGTKRSLRLFLG